MQAAREGTSDSFSQPHALEGVGEHSSNQNIPHISCSKVGNQQGVRAGSHPHMSHSTQGMNPPIQQMVDFFHRMAEMKRCMIPTG